MLARGIAYCMISKQYQQHMLAKHINALKNIPIGNVLYITHVTQLMPEALSHAMNTGQKMTSQ
jgi:hypothetical protein